MKESDTFRDAIVERLDHITDRLETIAAHMEPPMPPGWEVPL
jgi:hypothetical protein